MYVNNLPKDVTWQQKGWDSYQQHLSHKSNALTIIQMHTN